MMKIIEDTESRIVSQDDIKNIRFFIAMLLFLVVLGFFYYEDLKSDELWLCGFFCLLSVIGIFVSSTVRIEIDKVSKVIIAEKKRLIGSSLRIIPFSEVFAVETRRQWNMLKRSNIPSSLLRVVSVIILKNGEEIAVTNEQGTNDITDGLQGANLIIAKKNCRCNRCFP